MEVAVIILATIRYRLRNLPGSRGSFLIVPMCKTHQSILGVEIDRKHYLDKVEEIKENIAKYGRDFDPNLVLEDRNTAA